MLATLSLIMIHLKVNIRRTLSTRETLGLTAMFSRLSLPSQSPWQGPDLIVSPVSRVKGE